IIGSCMLGVLEGTTMAETVNFDQDKGGALPAGWKSGVTGRGSPRWMVEKDGTAPTPPNVLKQSGSGTFPWCVKSDTAIENGKVYIEQEDDRISGSGAVGVWTKADSVTAFDDFTYSSTASR